MSQRSRWSTLLQDGWGKLIEHAPSVKLDHLVHPGAPMYNSGVIGVTAGMADSLTLAGTLALDLYRLEPVFNIEQFVVGAALGQTYDVATAEDLLDHYCGYRRFIFHRHIPGALAELNGDLSPKATMDLAQITDLPKPLVARLRAQVHTRWHKRSATYRFAYLCYLCGCAARTAVNRQVWADIALDMIQRTDDKDLARRAFRLLRPEALPSSGLDPMQQAAWNAYWQGDDAAS